LISEENYWRAREGLTETEARVFEALARDGLTNQQIADRHFVVAGTVKTHLRNIVEKFGLDDGASSPKRVLLAIAFWKYEECRRLADEEIGGTGKGDFRGDGQSGRPSRLLRAALLQIPKGGAEVETGSLCPSCRYRAADRRRSGAGFK
jgi:DNA-binding CsgD family transcriptional regulator